MQGIDGDDRQQYTDTSELELWCVMRNSIIPMLVFGVLSACTAFEGEFFYDDFSENGISLWEESCGYGVWWAEDSMAHAANTASCAALLAPSDFQVLNCFVETRTTATHVCGVAARMYDPDNGVCAYVSPNHDVARIRRIRNGNVSTKYASIYHDFPSGVWYELLFICYGNILTLYIDVPQTGQTWVFSAIDPEPQSGRVGLMTGDEPHAYWDWFMADDLGSTGTVETSAAVNPLQITAEPNPFHSTVLLQITGMSADLSIRIYSIAGHLVDAFDIPFSGGSSMTFSWDGLNGSGNHLVQGVYFIEFASGLDTGSLKLIVID